MKKQKGVGFRFISKRGNVATPRMEFSGGINYLLSLERGEIAN